VSPGTPSIWSTVPAGESVASRLEPMVRRPVHAYLFLGPPGVGKEEAARAFAQALLCPAGGCGQCHSCRMAKAGSHPDLVEVVRTGSAITVDQARDVIAACSRMPLVSSRTVVILPDFHLVDEAAPALLKTLEEPPATTVIVVLADTVTPRLVTVASRCVEVAFPPLAFEEVVRVLVEEGASLDQAELAARISGGRLDRARRALVDPSAISRWEVWHTVPLKLEATGASAAAVATELIGALDAAMEPLIEGQREEMAEAVELAKEGFLVQSKSDIEQRHRREQRRLRTEELRFGLASLASSYRDRAFEELAIPGSQGSSMRGQPNPRRASASVRALGWIEEAAAALERNPNETLLIQALLVRLAGLA